jgi:phosphoribosylformylglycinamidine synthase
VLLKLMGCANIASKRWVYDQYDSTVRTNTVIGPGSDAAVLRIRHSRKALAVATDCNARYVYLNPRVGAQIAVAESARNVVCSGARPVAITNCLNFGNPYKPEMYYQFAEAVKGMGEACRIFETPVTGGNVSFYNEDPQRAVYPTPTIGMLGIIDDIDQITRSHFQREGDKVVLVGESKDELGGSEYIKVMHGLVEGDAPSIDLQFERKLHQFMLEAIQKDLIRSAHDLSDGGLAVALAEACIIDRENPIGATVTFTASIRKDALYFGESQSRLLLSVAPEHEGNIKQLAISMQVPIAVIGEVGGKVLKINDDIHVDLVSLGERYYNSIGRIMDIPEETPAEVEAR